MSDRDFHYYEPANGHGLSHNPLNALVAPRPIGWISSRDAQGRVNLTPYSFFRVQLRGLICWDGRCSRGRGNR